jgi:hypothetical protein
LFNAGCVTAPISGETYTWTTRGVERVVTVKSADTQVTAGSGSGGDASQTASGTGSGTGIEAASSPTSTNGGVALRSKPGLMIPVIVAMFGMMLI